MIKGVNPKSTAQTLSLTQKCIWNIHAVFFLKRLWM